MKHPIHRLHSCLSECVRWMLLGDSKLGMEIIRLMRLELKMWPWCVVVVVENANKNKAQCTMYESFSIACETKLKIVSERNCTNTDESKTFLFRWNPWGQQGKYVCYVYSFFFCMSTYFIWFLVFSYIYFFFLGMQPSSNESFQTLVQIFG